MNGLELFLFFYHIPNIIGHHHPPSINSRCQAAAVAGTVRVIGLMLGAFPVVAGSHVVAELVGVDKVVDARRLHEGVSVGLVVEGPSGF